MQNLDSCCSTVRLQTDLSEDAGVDACPWIMPWLSEPGPAVMAEGGTVEICICQG